MGFTFDGTTSKSMGIATRMATENRVPELNNRTIEIAGCDGLLDLGASLSERIVLVFRHDLNSDLRMIGELFQILGRDLRRQAILLLTISFLRFIVNNIDNEKNIYYGIAGKSKGLMKAKDISKKQLS